MKRILTVALLALILVGCGTSKKESLTECVINTSYEMYDDAIYTITATGDKVTKTLMRGTLDLGSKATADELMAKKDELLSTFNQLDGITADLERIDDTKVIDILEIDVENADLETLRSLGFAQGDEKAVMISLKQTIELQEDAGFICTTK